MIEGRASRYTCSREIVIIIIITSLDHAPPLAAATVQELG